MSRSLESKGQDGLSGAEYSGPEFTRFDESHDPTFVRFAETKNLATLS
jgi:hypothetical protein